MELLYRERAEKTSVYQHLKVIHGMAESVF